MRLAKKSPKLEADITLGNISKSEVNQLLASRDEKSKKIAERIGKVTRQNQHFLENVENLTQAISTSIDAAVAAVKMTNTVQKKQIEADIAIKQSGFELTQAEVAQRLNNTDLVYKGRALENSATRSLELIKIGYAGNEAVEDARHSTKIAQMLTNLDHKIEVQNAQIGDSQYSHVVSAQLSGQNPVVAQKQFHYVEPQNLQGKKHSLLGLAKSILGI